MSHRIKAERLSTLPNGESIYQIHPIGDISSSSEEFRGCNTSEHQKAECAFKTTLAATAVANGSLSSESSDKAIIAEDDANKNDIIQQELQQKNTIDSSKIRQSYMSSDLRSSEYQTGEKVCGQKVLEDEYFCEDLQNKRMKRNLLLNPNFFYKLRDHQPEWSRGVLIEFVFYHVLFYFFLGPFVNILFFSKRNLFYNFSFWGNRMYFYIQTGIFLMNATAIGLYVRYQHDNIYFVDIVYMQIGIFLRIFVICCKYASLPTEKIMMYREFILSTELTEADYYFRKWVFQDHSTIYREIYNALQRGDYDPQMFYVRFFVNPCTDKVNSMHREIAELAKFHKYENEEFQPACIFESTNSTESPSFYGYGIASLLLRNYAKNNGNGQLLAVTICFAMFRGALTLQYRLGAQKDFDFSTIEIIEVILIALITCYGYFSSFIFMVYFIRDLKMKHFLQQQCKLMLQFRKSSVDDVKFLPTIDFTDPYSFKGKFIVTGWSILRRVLLDYGKSYFMRLQAFLKIYLLVAIVSLSILLLQVYGLWRVQEEIILVCGFESFVMLSALLYMLYRGSMINMSFKQFKNQLVDYKVLVIDLIRLKTIYFEEKAVGISSMLRKHAVKRIQTSVAKQWEEEGMRAIDRRLEEILKSIEECDLELDQDEINSPFTLLSIKITEPMFKSILAALVTVGMAIMQKMMVHMMSESTLFDQW